MFTYREGSASTAAGCGGTTATSVVGNAHGVLGKGITVLVSEAGSGAHSTSSSQRLPKEGQGEKFYLGS